MTKASDETGSGGGRTFRIDVKRCFVSACDGELAEIAYYERNNWVTVELQCNRCHRKFTVKIES